MRVTRDALAVAKPMWMVGDSAYDTLDWHDHLLTAGVVPVAPYNARNTEDPKNIEYRVEDRIEEHSEDVQLKQSTLDKTYNRRTGVERTNESVKDCGLGRTHARVTSTHERTYYFSMPSPCRRNHQLRTWRQSWKFRDHGMRRGLYHSWKKLIPTKKQSWNYGSKSA